jgi:hypothetical protein
LYQNKTVLYIVGRTADTIDAAADVSGKKDLSALIGGRMATESSTPSVAICTIKVPPSIIPKLCEELIRGEEERMRMLQKDVLYIQYEQRAKKEKPTVQALKNVILPYLNLPNTARPAWIFSNCEKFKVEWCRFGELLGVSRKIIAEIENKHQSALNACCSTLFFKWLNCREGTGRKERTWDTVLEALYSGKSCIAKSFSLLLRPELYDIKREIVQYLGEDWYKVGENLNMSPDLMRTIRKKNDNIPERCSEAMFSKWLDHEEGTGEKHRTWETVLTALDDAGRRDLVTSVQKGLVLRLKEEEPLKKVPNIKDLHVLVIPHILFIWHLIGQLLGIQEVVLSEIEEEARKGRSVVSKQACEMFQLWLERAEGTGDEERSWSTILKALIKVGHSWIVRKVLRHLNPTATHRDIGQALSQLDPLFTSNDDVAFTSPGTVHTLSTQGTTVAGIFFCTSVVQCYQVTVDSMLP